MVSATAKGESFDPRKYLTKLKRRQRDGDGWKTVELEYLQVKHRVLWLRVEHPEAHITTEMVKDEHDEAVFRAEVSLPHGGSATGWGSETKADWNDYREKAESKALGRALSALGYGTQFCEDFDIDADPATKVVDSPTTANTPTDATATHRGGGNEPPASEKQIRALVDYAMKITGVNRELAEAALAGRYGTTIAKLTAKQVNESLAGLRERSNQSD